MPKKELLEEFDKIFGTCKDGKHFSYWVNSNIPNKPFEVSGVGKHKCIDNKEIKDFLSKAIDQTREETIREEKEKLDELLSALEDMYEQYCKEKSDELLSALEDMYEQYCFDGHAFTSAGEHASSVIERYGTLKLGNAGEILKSLRDK
ncbi:MAG: hypothetical protein WCX46_04245 [Candidatus Paceibacterota bacterium]